MASKYFYEQEDIEALGAADSRSTLCDAVDQQPAVSAGKYDEHEI